MTVSRAIAMPGFTSALLAAGMTPSLTFDESDDSFESVNKEDSASIDRIRQLEEEQDAQEQLYDFICYQNYTPDDDQWRYRVLIRDLMDEGPVFIAEQDASLEDTASILSDQTSDASIRVFFGAQSSSIPPGWRKEITSTPQIKHLTGKFDSDLSISSPACSPVAHHQEDSNDLSSSSHETGTSASGAKSAASSLHGTYLIELKKPEIKDVVFEAFVRASSPASQPSPSPKVPLSRTSLQASAPSFTPQDSKLEPVDSNDTSEEVSKLPSSDADKSGRREERPHLLPMRPIRSSALSGIKVLKLTNLPWSMTCSGLVKWLGNGVEKALVPLHIQIVSVHILCDRVKCRTKCPAFIEVTSNEAAREIIKHRNQQELQGRRVKINIVSLKELLEAIFPIWGQKHFVRSNATPVVTNAELEGLVELCKLKAPFAKSTPERPYMNLLSIAAKYPWQSVDLLHPHNEEQVRVLQSIRDGYKLLNQHGKRLPNYGVLKTLFITFLEQHGGVSGSLRPIPVAASHVIPTPDISPVHPLPRRPRVSQTLLELLRSSTQSNSATVNVTGAGERKATPEFISASAEARLSSVQGAPVKQPSTYILQDHAQIKTQQPSPPVTPEVYSVGMKTNKTANTAARTSEVGKPPCRTLQDFSRSSSPDKPTYASVAANNSCSPEIVEKKTAVEKLFTPIKPASYETRGQKPVSASGNESVDKIEMCDIVGKRAEKEKIDKGDLLDEKVGPHKTALLETLSQELGISQESIKELIKRLGAMI